MPRVPQSWGPPWSVLPCTRHLLAWTQGSPPAAGSPAVRTWWPQAGGCRLDVSQLGLPGYIPFLRARQPSSLVYLIGLFIALLISNSTLLRNNFRKWIFLKVHLVMSHPHFLLDKTT